MNDVNYSDNPWAGASQALVDEAMSNLRRLANMPHIAEQALKVKKGVTPSEVVYEEDRLKLLHYKSDKPPRFRTPLLFVFALVNRPYILDLLPGKSVVEHFVKAGFDTYLIDWGVPTAADRNNSLDTYINGYLLNVVKYLTKRTGAPAINLLGYCMGGTMSTIFTALYPERVKNLILMAAGIDYAAREGLLNLWTDSKYFDVDAFIDAYGNCPAHFLQSIFLALKPIQNIIEKPIVFAERSEDEKYVHDFFAMETWLNDNIPVAGETYREFVKYFYQQNRLVQNKLDIGGKKVELKKVVCPVLNIMATKDDLVPCAQSEPLNSLIGSTDKKIVKLAAGHVGLAVGSKAQIDVWPAACGWLAERSELLEASKKG